MQYQLPVVATWVNYYELLLIYRARRTFYIDRQSFYYDYRFYYLELILVYYDRRSYYIDR